VNFSEFAVYLQRLSETSSRIALVEILSELFGRVDVNEVRPTTYLLQGRLTPVFEPVEVGMGNAYLADAIASVYGVSRAEVLRRFDTLGDFGTVAAELAQAGAHSTAAPPLAVTSVFDRLLEIALSSGLGSVGRKVELLADLLARLDALSATYLCRVPAGRLRLGVGDPTVLEAFALAKLGDKRLRKPLERAYNETSDLGLVGETLWRGGLDAVERLSIRVGNPVRPALAQRLPDAAAIFQKLGPCAVEGKYDGLRCQVHKQGNEVRVFSRNLEEMTGAFPELVAGVLEQVQAEETIFEGEALAYNPLSDEYLPFQETVKRRRKHGVEAAAQALPLRLFVFDMLYVDGENVTPFGYQVRRERLRDLISPGEVVVVSPVQVVEAPGELEAFFDGAVQNGLEGVVAKRLDAPYQAGSRDYSWVKLKRVHGGSLQDTIDCVVVGYIYGRGKRAAFGIGALLVAVYDSERDVFTSISKIATGLSDDEWRGVRARCEPFVREEKPARVHSLLTPSVWVEPAVVIEVLADEITRSPVHTTGLSAQERGYALRFPRLVSFRDADKNPEDATTVSEVVDLYHQQRPEPKK
jgi:DNA ligase 1